MSQSATAYAKHASSRQTKAYTTADEMLKKAENDWMRFPAAREYLLTQMAAARQEGYSVEALREIKNAASQVLQAAEMRTTIKFEGQSKRYERQTNNIKELSAKMLGKAYIKQAEKQRKAGNYAEARNSFSNAARTYGSVGGESGIKKTNAGLAKLFVNTDKTARADLEKAVAFAGERRYGAAGDILVGLHQKYAHENNWPAAEAVWTMVKELDAAGLKEKRKDMKTFVNSDPKAALYLDSARTSAKGGKYAKAAVQLRNLALAYKRKGDTRAYNEVGGRIKELQAYMKPGVEATALEKNRRTREKGKANLKATRAALEKLFG